MSQDVAIRVDAVSKEFKLPHEKHSSIKSRAVSMFSFKKGYERQQALKDISFEVKKGEFFGVVGRNGSGKSTLLKILAGIYQPTKGKVSVSGKLVPFIELGVGFNPELTGRENVFLNGALLGFSSQEIAEQYDAIVAFAELEKFMDQKLKNYSSGMQVRLAFSMAVRANADILLIDEVLAVGDADFQRKCFNYFQKLKKDKKTVIFVSHDMDAVRQFCDRAVLIDSAHIKSEGETQSVAAEYTELLLHTTTKQRKKSLNKSKRTGSGEACITEATTGKQVYTSKDKEVTLSVTVKKMAETSQLMTGFTIKNSEGRYIHSSHTWKLQDDLDLEIGQEQLVTWTIPNYYEEGLYHVDLQAYGSNHVIYDSLEDSLEFEVKRTHKSGCLVTFPVDVKLGEGPRATLPS